MNNERTEEEIWKQTQDFARRFYVDRAAPCSAVSVSIRQWPERGDVWAYSVSIGDGVHKIGAAESYESAARLAKSGVKSAMKYLSSLPNVLGKTHRGSEPDAGNA